MAATQAMIDWGVAARPLPGQDLLGDAFLVETFPEGVLVAAIDGLGHGKEAFEASERAIAALRIDVKRPLPELFDSCHKVMARMRGAVISLASISSADETMTWFGVGNVDAALYGARPGNSESPRLQWKRIDSLPQRAGVVGYQMPAVRPSRIALQPGDLLLFHTDGIRSNYFIDLDFADDPQSIATEILNNCAKETDDALALAVRWNGSRQPL